MAVTADDPLRLVEEGESLGRQRQQRGLLDFDKHLADLFLRRSVDPRVGHRRFPAEQMLVLLLQRREAAPLRPLSCTYATPRSTFPLCRGVRGLVGKITVP